MSGMLRRSRRNFYLLLFAAVLVVLLLLGLQIRFSYQETMHEAATTTSNYAAMLEARLEATLRRADAVLQRLVLSIPAAALDQQAAPKYARELDADLDSHLVNFEEVAALRVFDVNGDLLYTSARANVPPTNIADRSHFRALRDNPRAGLVFSEVIIGRITDRKILVAARALHDARGVFAGVVVAAIELDHFQKLFQSLDTGSQGLIAIRRSDNFGLIVRWPPSDSKLNKGLPPSNRLRAALDAGKKQATIEFRANIDGIMRIFSYHALERYPFYVAAGLARDDVLAGWRKRSLAIAGAGLSLMCLAAGLLLSLWRMAVREAQKTAELADSERFVRSILDTVDEGFIVVDRNYRILTANKAYCDQAALPCGEVIGRQCHALSHKTSRPCFEEGEDCAVRQVFLTGEPYSAVHKHPGADGQMLFVETKAYPIKDVSGNTTSVIETLNNITEKHLLESERLKTQKLESIGTLAGGIAHDFNNLLQGIFGYISLAKLCLDQKERALAMIEQAELALHQSVSLTTQLLTFSRGGKPVRAPITLEPVIENAVKFALSGSHTEYRLVTDPDLWRVDADAGQLSQVIQNIVMNADQAMPLGGCVTITARNAPPSDPELPQGLARRNHVMISIRDNGVGIPEQDLHKIFDPYFTTKEKGSGLGLATSYSIVRNHEGWIFVKSAVGKGSTFVLCLPASDAAVQAPQRAAIPAPARAASILVMDDEVMIRNIAGELLRVLGHTVAFADRGETAIEAFRAARDAGRPFDLVILDLTIRGGMGGVETVRRLREIDPEVKAVASSGYSDDATLADHRAQGFAAFLKKPYNITVLQDTLNSLLG